MGWAEEPPPPTPVPLLGGEMAEGNGFIVPMAGETWSAIAYWFYSSSTGLKANYQCSQSTPSANSQQIWCDATYRGYYGSTWYALDNLWSSRWGGGELTVNGSRGMTYGSYVLHAHGTHLFDYGPNNWVWRESDDYEDYIA